MNLSDHNIWRDTLARGRFSSRLPSGTFEREVDFLTLLVEVDMAVDSIQEHKDLLVIENYNEEDTMLWLSDEDRKPEHILSEIWQIYQTAINRSAR